jgi:hypothetical protein
MKRPYFASMWTNESRKNIVDNRYATYKGKYMKCIDVIHKFDQGFKQNAQHKLWKKICNNTDYYLLFEPAFYSQLTPDMIKNGIFKKWDTNGQLMKQITYENGKPCGRYQELNENTMKVDHGEYINGMHHSRSSAFEEWTDIPIKDKQNDLV